MPGYRNPETPGDYEIQVIAETGLGGAVQTGAANLHIRPEIAPSINLTAVYDPMRRNTVFQEVQSGDEIVPHDFWLWDEQGLPMLGVEIVGDDLQRGDQVVGQISITSPSGASGQSLVSTEPSTLVNEVFFGRETARLNAQFTAGDLLGEYVTTIGLLDGTSQQFTVNVIPEPSTLLLAVLSMASAFRFRRVC